MTEKRRFYNTGDAKGFTKASFFEAVQALASGEEVDDATVALVAAAAAYELEGIAANKKTATPGERKDALQSDYAVALRAAILPLLTSEPQTVETIVAKATAAGNLSPKGTEWSKPWVSRVLNALDGNGVRKVTQIVTKTDSKGLNSQKEANAYAKA